MPGPFDDETTESYLDPKIIKRQKNSSLPKRNLQVYNNFFFLAAIVLTFVIGIGLYFAFLTSSINDLNAVKGLVYDWRDTRLPQLEDAVLEVDHGKNVSYLEEEVVRLSSNYGSCLDKLCSL